jgi:hypothetical protein
MNNKQNIKGVIQFVVFKALVMSVVLNILVPCLFAFINFKTIPEILFGLDWTSFHSLPLKILILTLMIYAVYGGAMFLSVGFKKYGVLNGLGRIALTLGYIFNQFTGLSSYLTWGQNGPINLIALFTFGTLTHLLTYFEMQSYERRSS